MNVSVGPRLRQTQTPSVGNSHFISRIRSLRRLYEFRHRLPRLDIKPPAVLQYVHPPRILLCMAPHFSRLLALPYEVIELVVLDVALLDLLGPPHHLFHLLLTCKSFHYAFSFKRCPILYYRMFPHRFDCHAALRRNSEVEDSPELVAAQLKQYVIAMKRIRHADINGPNLLRDLWTLFVMFAENDGRNEKQLAWAHLDTFLHAYITNRLMKGRHHDVSDGWPLESTSNTLVLWLLWHTLTRDKYNAITLQRRKQLMDLVRPFAIVAVRYPAFHAPDNHFDIPFSARFLQSSPGVLETPHGYYPTYRDPSLLIEWIQYYGRPLAIVAPPIALVAKLLYMALYEKLPFRIPDSLPRDRQTQIGWTYVGPTQEDFAEVNANKAVQLRERGTFDGVNETASLSSRWDNDWARWTSCLNPSVERPLKRILFTYGSMTGSFSGRMLVPDFDQYGEVARAQIFPETFSDANPRLTFAPLFFELQEHHCIDPQEPVATGGIGDGFDDGVMNAWFPPAELHQVNGELRVDDLENRCVSHYKTYVHGGPSMHDVSTCRRCIRVREMEEETLHERVRAHTSSEEAITEDVDMMDEDLRTTSRPRSLSRSSISSNESYLDDDVHSARATMQRALDDLDLDELLEQELSNDSSVEDGWDDSSAKECDGVRDVIITGETSMRHGQAWHHYRFYGRVRRWDGLIALVRVPTQFPQLGKFIFRGYVVGDANFVGSWRVFSSNIHVIPLEGPFVASKVEAPAAPA
ncbi:hypothetical protein A0H81_13997 [Grifola frondosa]|uniref:F-box domain-containing protein n=1 Tax=Grifola frondosa TaxID=5627 RepID=A0A1C7LQ12_GRIFR|nr:hypothetical protein A0H81_13997 [Grifola frondosa]